MATIAELLIKLGMDDGGLDKGMSSSQSKLKSWGENLRSIGTKLTAGVTLPLVGAGLAAIKWASDLDESLNKSQVLFGDAFDDVLKFSEGSAKALGFSQQATLDYAAAYAGMLNTVAETDTELGDMSTTLTQLTSDFASFHNLNPEEAFTVIQSALAGETEAIRRYGVDVSAAAVETEALAMGLAATASELTEQDKLLARYSLLLKSTTEEQGDFARTANSTSNQMKILRARIQDVGAGFGKILLPYVNRFLSAMLDLLDRFDELDPKWQKIILAVAAFAAVLGPALIALSFMLPALGALATVIGFLLSPIGLLVIAIAALIGLGIYAWAQDLWGVRDAVDAAIDAFGRFADGLDAFRKYIQAVLEDGDMMNDWLTHLPEVLQPIVMMLGQVALALQDFWAMMGPVLGDFYDALQALGEGDWREVLDELQEAFLGLGEALSTLSADILQILADYFNDLSDSAGALGPTLSTLSLYFSEAADGMRRLAAAFSAALAGDWVGFFTNIGLAILNLVQSLGQLNIAFGQLAIAAIQKFAEGLQQAWTGTVVPWLQGRGVELLNQASTWALGMLQKGSDLITQWLNGVIAMWPAALLIFNIAKQDVLNAFTQMATDAKAKAGELVEGVMQNFTRLQILIKSKVGEIYTAIKTDFENAKTSAISTVSALVSDVTAKFNTLSFSIFTHVTNIKNNIVNAFTEAVPGVASAMATLTSTVVGALISLVSSCYSMAYSAGAAIGSGLLAGIQSFIGAILGALDGLISSILGKLSDVPGFSPIEHVGQYYGAKLSGGFAEGIASMSSDAMLAAGSVVDAAMRPLDASVSPGGEFGAGGGGGNTYISISLKSQELIDLIRNAEDGGEFSRNFGRELAMYGGNP